MNEQILKDLAKHFDQRFKALMTDFSDRCQAVDIPDGRILAELLASTLGFASMVVAKTSSVSPEVAAELFKEHIMKMRKANQEKQQETT